MQHNFAGAKIKTIAKLAKEMKNYLFYPVHGELYSGHNVMSAFLLSLKIIKRKSLNCLKIKCFSCF